jgi:hypothetical protein
MADETWIWKICLLHSQNVLLATLGYHNYMEILIQEIKITEFAHI